MDFEKDIYEIYINKFIDDKNGLKLSKVKEKEFNKIRDKFVNRLFPIDHILDMTMDEYCIGLKDIKSKGMETFCYLIERQMKQTGSILGSTSDKFGVFYHKYDKSKPDVNEGYYCTKKWSETYDCDEALENIKKEIHRLLIVTKTGSLAKIRDEYEKNKLSPMLKSKILSVYFSNKFLHQHDETYVDIILSNLGISFEKDIGIFAKKELLFKLKESNEITRKWSTIAFTDFLWNYFYDQKIIVSSKHDYGTTELKISLLSLNKLTRSNSTSIPNYVKAQKAKQAIGMTGESIVVEWEKNRLKSLHNKNWKKVKQISVENPHAGYDILSFNEDGSELHIEVKSLSSNIRGNIHFYITNNELNRMHNDPNYSIYLVGGVKSKEYTISVLDLKFLKENKPEPILYYYDINI